MNNGPHAINGWEKVFTFDFSTHSHTHTRTHNIQFVHIFIFIIVVERINLFLKCHRWYFKYWRRIKIMDRQGTQIMREIEKYCHYIKAYRYHNFSPRNTIYGTFSYELKKILTSVCSHTKFWNYKFVSSWAIRQNFWNFILAGTKKY